MTAFRHRPAALGLLVAVLALAACEAPPADPAATGSPAAVSPSAASQGAVATPDAVPSPTRWPGGVVEAVLILARADAEIQEAGTDLARAAADEDLGAMRGAADGLATLLSRLDRQVPRLAEYPATAPAARAYQAAFPDMLAGATEVRDAIDRGDAAGLESGSTRLAAGLRAYQAARRLIGPLADQALVMQRLLVK